VAIRTLKQQCYIWYSHGLTLSDRAEYIYSATSQATSPDGVLVLRDFHKQKKKKSTEDIGFRFVPLDSSMFVVSVTLLASC
jgi:hypothetical protein